MLDAARAQHYLLSYQKYFSPQLKYAHKFRIQRVVFIKATGFLLRYRRQPRSTAIFIIILILYFIRKEAAAIDTNLQFNCGIGETNRETEMREALLVCDKLSYWTQHLYLRQESAHYYYY